MSFNTEFIGKFIIGVDAIALAYKSCRSKIIFTKYTEIDTENCALSAFDAVDAGKAVRTK